MVHPPLRGRSAWHPGDGETRMFPPRKEEFQFTANAVRGTWAQAKKHTQWPGDGPNKGQKGDPIFDAFYATLTDEQKKNLDGRGPRGWGWHRWRDR